jgi:hypothetical protein
MAHRHRPFYNLDKAVGLNQPNATDDVMLVQFFLSELSNVHTIFVWNKPTEPLKVDGIKSQNLFNWIRSYQQGIKSQGSPVAADGIVNPARGAATTRSTITNTIYTIVFLNNHFESLFPDRFGNLARDLKVPQPLRTSLERGV